MYGKGWKMKCLISYKENHLFTYGGNKKGFRIELTDLDGKEIEGLFWDDSSVYWFDRLNYGSVYSFEGGNVKIDNKTRKKQINFNRAAEIKELCDEDPASYKKGFTKRATPNLLADLFGKEYSSFDEIN
jgi:hypothetical protein